MDLNTLIAECTTYDFKLMLEEKKPKSWLKSVSAFANGLGGSLFFGIDNDGIARGLDDVQHVCEAISTKIRDYMDPLIILAIVLINAFLGVFQEKKAEHSLTALKAMQTPHCDVLQGIILRITTLGMFSALPLSVLVTRVFLLRQNIWYD